MGRSVHSTFVFPHHLGVRLVSRGGLRSGGLPCLSALSLSLMTAGFLFCGAASPVLANSAYGDISDPYMVSDHVVIEDYADHSSTNVTQSGHLELSGAYFCTANLEVSGQLTVGSGAQLENVYGPAGEFAGTAELHSGARLQVEVDGYAELWEVVSRGRSLILSTTATEASEFTSNAEVHIQKLTADMERTLVTVGEDNAQADQFSTLMIEELSVSSGGHLDIRVGSGGAFVWTHAAFDDGNEAGTDPIENFFFTPAAAPQGAVRVQKNASLTRGMSIAVGGSSTEREAASNSWNLWVGSGGVLSIEGEHTTLTLEDGTKARFEAGSTLLLSSLIRTDEDDALQDAEDGADSPASSQSADRKAASDIPSAGTTFKVEGLDLSRAEVSGLENLTLKVEGLLETGGLYFDASGAVVGVLGRPTFEGPLASMLQELYENRTSLLVPSFYRTLFTNTSDVVEGTMMAVATAASSTGTNERLMQNAVSTSMRLASAARMAEAQAARAAEIRSLEAQRAASRKAAADSEKADPDWTERLKAWRTNLQEHLPAMVQDVPVFIGASAGSTKVDVSTPVSKPFTVKSEDTTFDAAVIFGREDWRVGLMGSFTTRSLDTLYKQGAAAELGIDSESDEASASFFVRRRLGSGWGTVDLTWLEADDRYRMGAAREYLEMEKLKRRIYSSGFLYEQPLFAGSALSGSGPDRSWVISGFAGLRYLRVDTAEGTWRSPAGAVLTIREASAQAVAATAGGVITGALHFAPGAGYWGQAKPRRLDVSLTAALNSTVGGDRDVMVQGPAGGSTSSATVMTTAESERFQWNAELDAGIEWRDSRLDFSGFASRAGSSVRTAGGSVKMSWRLNLL